MNVVCLDLEGVLVPEIWIAFAKASGIPELERTTRDEPDYDKLMNFRLDILREHGLGLAEIQDVIATIDPMEGAREFLDALREKTQVIIISDTFEQFAQPLMRIFVQAGEVEVLAAGVRYLRIEGACYVGIGCLFLLYGFYRAVKRPGMSVVLTVISLGVRVALAYLLAGPVGEVGIWAAIPIGWALADVTGYGYYLLRRTRLLPEE